MINAEERKSLVRVASTMPNGDGLRRAILAGLLRLAEDEEGASGSGKGPGKDFIEYMKEVWDGGKKKVSNPNPKTRDSLPEVAVSTAMKDKKSTTYKQVMDGFKKWTEEKKKGGDDKKSSKPLPDQKKARSIKKKMMEQAHSPANYNAPYGQPKVTQDVNHALNSAAKAQGARFIGSGNGEAFDLVYKDYKDAQDKFRSALFESSKSGVIDQDTLDGLESAFNHVKDTAKKAVENAKKIKFPQDLIEKWNKEAEKKKRG